MNFNKIKFKPNEFTNYLLSKEIGFSTCKTIAMPHNKSKGFRRPMLLYTKLDAQNNSSSNTASTSENSSTVKMEIQ